MFFLLSRYHQQHRNIPELLETGTPLLSDYTFDKDALFARTNLDGDELEMYYKLHEALAENIPVPDLTVYLRASTNMLMHRITLRDRPYERAMERDYIEMLNVAYDAHFMQSEDQHDILVIDSNELDFVKNEEDLSWIENRIRQRLQLPPFQPELPISGNSAE
jgi:deoxyguanosine kinase